jgi:hypothetical protein
MSDEKRRQAAERQRRRRERQRRGLVPLVIEVDEAAIVGRLLDLGRLTEAEALDRDRLAKEIGRLLHDTCK